MRFKRLEAQMKISPYVTAKGGVVILNGPFPMEEAKKVAALCEVAPDLLKACEAAARSYHHPTCTCRGERLANPERYCICHVGAAITAIAKAKKVR